MKLYPKFLKMGTQYGRLKVIGINGNSTKRENETNEWPSKWEYWCSCECGNIVPVRKCYLVNGETRSCGCLSQETRSKNGIKSRKRNPIEQDGTIIKIFFFQQPNEYAIIDVEDYSKVKDFCWCRLHDLEKDTYYAGANSRGKYNKKTIRMHQIICPCEEGFIPDHENGNGLDNRKSNLRPLTYGGNCTNIKTKSNNTSGVTGVYWHKVNNNWFAVIPVNKRVIRLGSYERFEDACKARWDAEELYHGEASCRRTPEEEEFKQKVLKMLEEEIKEQQKEN